METRRLASAVATANRPALSTGVVEPGERRGPTSAPGRRTSIEGAVLADRVYRWAVLGFALCIPLLLLLIFVEVGRAGWPALRQFGFAFLTTSVWDPVAGEFGAAPAPASPPRLPRRRSPPRCSARRTRRRRSGSSRH
jgi:phosphate transport system permease protein